MVHISFDTKNTLLKGRQKEDGCLRLFCLAGFKNQINLSCKGAIVTETPTIRQTQSQLLFLEVLMKFDKIKIPQFVITKIPAFQGKWPNTFCLNMKDWLNTCLWLVSQITCQDDPCLWLVSQITCQDDPCLWLVSQITCQDDQGATRLSPSSAAWVPGQAVTAQAVKRETRHWSGVMGVFCSFLSDYYRNSEIDNHE